MAPSFFIQGTGCISPQRTYDNSEFLPNIATSHDNNLICQVPDFKKYISPVALRRMSRLLKMGLSAAKICTDEATLTMPDAIICSSGYGCIDETTKFLIEILQNKERQLTPTFFMGSTYNALAGAIALHLKCNHYNTTYAHRGFAFETAMLDACLQLLAAPHKRILVGAADEVNHEQSAVLRHSGLHKRALIHSLDLYNSDGQGTLQGEGANFFTLGTTRTNNTYCEISLPKMLYAPTKDEEWINLLQNLLHEYNLQTSDIDIIVNGAGGDTEKDSLINNSIATIFPNTTEIRYKHLVGDYCVAGAFGVWVAAKILKEQRLPTSLIYRSKAETKEWKHILSLNHFWGKNYSAFLLKK